MKNQDDKEEERQRKRQEKLEKVLNPKHHYDDKNYTISLQQNADKIDEALSYGNIKIIFLLIKNIWRTSLQVASCI